MTGRRIWQDDIPCMRPGDERTITQDGHAFRITATATLGCDTGRRRYRVECVTCSTIVHESTTGPIWNVGFHIREVATAPSSDRPTPTKRPPG